jgi:site-specific recombinase XerD
MAIQTTTKSANATTSPDDVRALLTSWRRSLAARRVSPATIATYTSAVERLADFLEAQGMPTRVGAIRREHVEAFIADLLTRRSPATAHNRYRGCQAFFTWATEDGEVKVSPMVHMKQPRLPETPPPVLREAQLQALLDACARDKSFNGRRDEAILRLLIDTGIRRAEVLGLRVADVDLDHGLVTVTGKGSRTRVVAIGTGTVLTLDRYLRARAKRDDAGEPWLWLGRKGRLRETGLAELIRDRCRQAGIPAALAHPHAFRHAYAQAMLAAGMQEHDLMAIAGWRSPAMLARYAASTRQERALVAAKAMSPGDKLDAADHDGTPWIEDLAIAASPSPAFSSQ